MNLKKLHYQAMERIKDFTIDKKVRWFYQIDQRSKPTDEIVYIASKIIGSKLVRINRKDINGKMVEGGYVNINELYETN